MKEKHKKGVTQGRKENRGERHRPVLLTLLSCLNTGCNHAEQGETQSVGVINIIQLPYQFWTIAHPQKINMSCLHAPSAQPWNSYFPPSRTNCTGHFRAQL